MKPYKIELDDFSGPMDLLLYLVRREEVAIEELSIAKITEQYLAFLEQVREVDVDGAGDYLVMAAQLLQLKTRALLPEAPEEAIAPEEPYTRNDLIQNLLEYKRLQEHARLLQAHGARALLRFERRSERRIEEIPLRNVDVWDLVTAYRLLQQQLGERTGEEAVVEADPEPLHVHVARLRERLRDAGAGVDFHTLLGPEAERGTLVASFLALLELIRTGDARANQEAPFGSLRVRETTDEERAALALPEEDADEGQDTDEAEAVGAGEEPSGAVISEL